MASITPRPGPHPELTVIEVVGEPTWDDITVATVAYNQNAATRLTLWDWRQGRLPEFDNRQAADRVGKVADVFEDIPNRRTAFVTSTERDFGLARIIGAWVETEGASRGWKAVGAAFRDYDEAVAWLLESQ